MHVGKQRLGILQLLFRLGLSRASPHSGVYSGGVGTTTGDRGPAEAGGYLDGRGEARCFVVAQLALGIRPPQGSKPNGGDARRLRSREPGAEGGRQNLFIYPAWH
jgi:hypothetical protein